MSTPAPVDAKPLSRRERQRLATVAEIKALARQQLAEAGPGALSLRAIARDMGMASSALYRYFASYDELIGTLCVDAYNSVADALTDARDAQPADDPPASGGPSGRRTAAGHSTTPPISHSSSAPPSPATRHPPS